MPKDWGVYLGYCEGETAVILALAQPFSEPMGAFWRVLRIRMVKAEKPRTTIAAVSVAVWPHDLALVPVTGVAAERARTKPQDDKAAPPSAIAVKPSPQDSGT